MKKKNLLIASGVIIFFLICLFLANKYGKEDYEKLKNGNLTTEKETNTDLAQYKDNYSEDNILKAKDEEIFTTVTLKDMVQYKESNLWTKEELKDGVTYTLEDGSFVEVSITEKTGIEERLIKDYLTDTLKINNMTWRYGVLREAFSEKDIYVIKVMSDNEKLTSTIIHSMSLLNLEEVEFSKSLVPTTEFNAEDSKEERVEMTDKMNDYLQTNGYIVEESLGSRAGFWSSSKGNLKYAGMFGAVGPWLELNARDGYYDLYISCSFDGPNNEVQPDMHEYTLKALKAMLKQIGDKDETLYKAIYKSWWEDKDYISTDKWTKVGDYNVKLGDFDYQGYCHYLIK